MKMTLLDEHADGTMLRRMMRRAGVLRLVRAAVCAVMITGAVMAGEGDADRVVASHIPPVMIQGDDVTPGYAIEILRDAARRAGRDIAVEFYPFKRAVHIMQGGQPAMFPSLFRTPAREEDYQWVAPITSEGMLFVARGTFIDTMERARALRAIAVPDGGVADRILSERGFDNLVRVAGAEAALAMLKAGRVEAWMTSGSVARKHMEEGGIGQDVVRGEPVVQITAYVAASHAVPQETVLHYRAALEAMATDGTIARLTAKYGFVPE